MIGFFDRVVEQLTQGLGYASARHIRPDDIVDVPL